MYDAPLADLLADDEYLDELSAAPLDGEPADGLSAVLLSWRRDVEVKPAEIKPIPGIDALP